MSKTKKTYLFNIPAISPIGKQVNPIKKKTITKIKLDGNSLYALANCLKGYDINSDRPFFTETGGYIFPVKMNSS